MIAFLWFFVGHASFLKAQSDSALHPQLQRFADAIVASNDTTLAGIKNRMFESLVFEFVRTGQMDVLSTLANKSVPLKIIRDSTGNTLLHVAASNGHQNVVSLLIEQGVPVDALNQENRSALFYAANENRIAVVKLLLNAEASVNQDSSQHPISTAAWYGNSEIVSLLLNANASTESTDSDGNTPLHKAVWQSNYKCVRLLVAAGSDCLVKNSAGQTPMSMAVERARQSKKSVVANRAWGTEQLLGKPDAGNDYSQLEWCPSTQSGGPEWLGITFEKSVVPAQVEVYAKPTPLSITRIGVFDDEGTEYEAWNRRMGMTQEKGSPKHIAHLRLKLKHEFKSERIKIYIDSSKDPGWIYYDAVGLVAEDGEKQWAEWVEASSCYAQGPAPERLHHKQILKLLNSQADK